MLADNPGQPEHCHLWLSKHRQQFGVGVDVALVGRVLQFIGLNGVIQFFYDVRARYCHRAYDGCQRCAGLPARAISGCAWRCGLGGGFGGGTGGSFCSRFCCYSLV